MRTYLKILAAVWLSLAPSVALSYTGTGAVWGQGRGAFVATNYAGTGTGLQQAIDAMPSGGYIQVGAGRFVLSSTIRIPYSGITIYGAGDSTVFCLSAVDTAFAIAVGANNVRLENFTIDGRSSDLAGGTGIAVYANRGAHIEGVRFRSLYDFGIVATTGSSYATITKCRFRNIGSAATTNGTAARITGSWHRFVENDVDSTTGLGVWLNGADHYTVDENMMQHTAWYSIGTQTADPGPWNYKGGAVLADTTSQIGTISRNKVFNYGGSSDNIQAMGDSTVIAGNFLAGGRSGIHWGYNWTAGRGSSIIGNHIIYPKTFGMFVEALTQSMDGMAISDNTLVCYGTQSDGIDIESGGGLTSSTYQITNNRIYGPTGSGIRLKLVGGGSYRDTDISSNTVIDAGAHGIYLDQASGSGNFTGTLVVGNRVINAGMSPIRLDFTATQSDGWVSGNVGLDCGLADYIGSTWTIAGTSESAIRATSVAVYDSLNVTGVFNVGRKNGLPQYHTIGVGGTDPADTVSIALNGTSDGSGLATRGPKFYFNRNGATEGTIAGYGGGIEMRFNAGDRLAIGQLGLAGTNTSLYTGGQAAFGDTVTATSFRANQYFQAPTGKGYVLEGTSKLLMSNVASISVKDTAGVDHSVISTAGGTNILRIQPILSGRSIDVLNFAGDAANVTFADGGAVDIWRGKMTVADSVIAKKGLRVGVGGTQVNKILRGSASLDFDLTTNISEDLKIYVPGASGGDEVSLGIPNSAMMPDIHFFAWVSTADSVTVRATRAAGTPNPASGTFKVMVTQ